MTAWSYSSIKTFDQCPKKYFHLKIAKDIQDKIVGPLQGVQAEFATGRYLTRLFTTVSPVEMNKDPIFGFNPTLPTVSPVHTAKAVPICAEGSSVATKVKYTYADGTELTLDLPPEATSSCFFGGYGVSFAQSGDASPVSAGGQAAKSVEVLDETGAALPIQPGAIADKVDAQLSSAKLGTPSLTAAFKASLPPVTWKPYQVGSAASAGADVGNPTSSATSVSGGGCTGQNRGNAVGWLSLTVLTTGLWLLRRRTSRLQPVEAKRRA